MGAERGRYFLAVTLPQAQREDLSKLQDSGRGFSWTRKENLHLTLRFIGDVETERIEQLIESMKEIDVVRFILPLEGVGAFPSRGRARVIWAGVGNGYPRLFQLRQRVDDMLLHVGIDADLKHFHPHVTISRIREDAKQSSVLEWLKRWSDYQGPPFRVESIRAFYTTCRKE